MVSTSTFDQLVYETDENRRFDLIHDVVSKPGDHDYTLKRLCGGLVSPRGVCKLSFGAALCLYLKEHSQSISKAVAYFKQLLSDSSSLSKSEVTQGCLSLPLFAGSILSSKIDLSEDNLADILELLLHVFNKKTNLKVQIVLIIEGFLNHPSVNAENVKQKMRTDFETTLTLGFDKASAADIQLLLLFNRVYPDMFDKGFLKKYWGSGNLYSQKCLEKMVKIIYQHANHNGWVLPPLATEVAQSVVDSNKLEDFVEFLTKEYCNQSTSHNLGIVFKFILLIVEIISDSSALESIMHKTIIETFLDSRRKPGMLYHQAAVDFQKFLFGSIAKKSGQCQLVVVKAFLGLPFSAIQELNNDLNQLIRELPVEQLQELFDYVSSDGNFLAKHVTSNDGPELHIRFCQWYVIFLTNLSKNIHLTNSFPLQKELLSSLMWHTGVMQEVLDTPAAKMGLRLCKFVPLNKCVDKLSTVVHNLATTNKCNFTNFIQSAIYIMRKLEKHQKEQSLKKMDGEGGDTRGTIHAALKCLKSLPTDNLTDMKQDSTVKCLCVGYLLGHASLALSLQSFGPGSGGSVPVEEIASLTDDLIACWNNREAEDGPPWIDFVAESVVSILSWPNCPATFRDIATTRVFATLLRPLLTPSALDVITAALAPSRGDKSDENDEDDDSSSTSSTLDDDESEDEEDQAVLKMPVAIVANGDNESTTSGPDEDDIDVETLGEAEAARLDAQFANSLAARRNESRIDTTKRLAQFRLRLLGLLESVISTSSCAIPSVRARALPAILETLLEPISVAAPETRDAHFKARLLITSWHHHPKGYHKSSQQTTTAGPHDPAILKAGFEALFEWTSRPASGPLLTPVGSFAFLGLLKDAAAHSDECLHEVEQLVIDQLESCLLKKRSAGSALLFQAALTRCPGQSEDPATAFLWKPLKSLVKDGVSTTLGQHKFSLAINLMTALMTKNTSNYQKLSKLASTFVACNIGSFAMGAVAGFIRKISSIHGELPKDVADWTKTQALGSAGGSHIKTPCKAALKNIEASSRKRKTSASESCETLETCNDDKDANSSKADDEQLPKKKSKKVKTNSS